MSSASNSFKQMLEEDELRFPPPPELEESVLGSLQMLAVMGKAMELFIPKAFDMFILTLGGALCELDPPARDELAGGSPRLNLDDDTPGMAGGDFA